MIDFSEERLPRLSARVPCGLSILLLLAGLSSCGSSKSVESATKSVEQFHSQLNAEQYQNIYAAADAGLQKVSTEGDFVALLQAVHKKLGNVQTSQCVIGTWILAVIPDSSIEVSTVRENRENK